MLASTLVASFFVPLFFVVLESAGGIFSRKKGVPLHPGEKEDAHA
jgi:hypothetical protein